MITHIWFHVSKHWTISILYDFCCWSIELLQWNSVSSDVCNSFWPKWDLHSGIFDEKVNHFGDTCLNTRVIPEKLPSTLIWLYGYLTWPFLPVHKILRWYHWFLWLFSQQTVGEMSDLFIRLYRFRPCSINPSATVRQHNDTPYLVS